jgi:hypothetical protein
MHALPGARQTKPDSTRQSASQPSPARTLKSSHVSAGVTKPSPQYKGGAAGVAVGTGDIGKIRAAEYLLSSTRLTAVGVRGHGRTSTGSVESLPPAPLSSQSPASQATRSLPRISSSSSAEAPHPASNVGNMHARNAEGRSLMDKALTLLMVQRLNADVARGNYTMHGAGHQAVSPAADTLTRCKRRV